MKKLVFALLLLLGVGISPVFACTAPADYFDNTLDEQIERVPIIFIGRVSNQWALPDNSDYYSSFQIEVEVSRYLKGDGSAVVVIDDFGGHRTCSDFHVPAMGVEYIFFVNEYNGVFRPYPHWAQPAFRPVDDAIVSQITGQTNYNATPEPLPLPVQTSRLVQKYDDWILRVGLTIGAIAASSLLIRRVFGRRKSKAKREL
jgi:hypothetical protein